MKVVLAATMAALLLLSQAARANESKPVVTLQSIVEQQRGVAAQIADGSLALRPRERGVVEKAQVEVFALVEGKQVLADLDIAEKARLENALTRIDAALKGGRRAEEVTQVCWRERTIGSKLMTTRCGTREEIQAAREGARDFMQRPRTCVSSDTASCGQ